MAEGYSLLKETDLSCRGRGRTGLCVSGTACQQTAEMGGVPVKCLQHLPSLAGSVTEQVTTQRDPGELQPCTQK